MGWLPDGWRFPHIVRLFVGASPTQRQLFVHFARRSSRVDSAKRVLDRARVRQVHHQVWIGLKIYVRLIIRDFALHSRIDLLAVTACREQKASARLFVER